MQVYICPWCDRMFNSESDRIAHLLTDHGVEVREDGDQAEHVKQVEVAVDDHQYLHSKEEESTEQTVSAQEVDHPAHDTVVDKRVDRRRQTTVTHSGESHSNWNRHA